MNQNEVAADGAQGQFNGARRCDAQQRAAIRCDVAPFAWFVAPWLMHGLTMVLGVVLMSGWTVAVARAPQEAGPLPPVVKVRGMAKLLQADRRVENLSCAIEGPDFGPLQEFVRLRALRVEQDHDLPHPTLVQSAWSLAPVARCTRLESLAIGSLARFTAVELAPIAALPSLRSLELVGSEKDVDADFVAVLAKLPLRSLVLHAVHILPEGLRALGELPLLERLELRDCTGLDKCDLKHLYRLRQLQALTLRGIGVPREVVTRVGMAVSIELPEMRDGKFSHAVTSEWAAGLARALPDLRELDLAESRIDDDVLAALPRGLTFLGLRATLGYGERGVAAVGALPELRALAIGDPIPSFVEAGSVPVAIWLPLLRQKKLQRIEFAGIPTDGFCAALRQQSELRQVRLDIGPAVVTTNDGGTVMLGGRTPIDSGTPIDFAFLADLPRLERIDLLRPSQSIEKAIRQAVGDRVRVDVLPR